MPVAELAPPVPNAPVLPTPNERVVRERFADVPWGEQHSYVPDHNGLVYTTSTFTEAGTEIAWREHRQTNRFNVQAMLTTQSGNQFYVYGDRVFDMTASKNQGRPVSVELPLGELLPTATIGESWATPFGSAEPLSKVEVLHEKLDPTEARALVDLFPPTGGKNDIAEAAALFAPHQSRGYRLPRKTELKRAAIEKAIDTVDTLKTKKDLSKKAMKRAAKRTAEMADNAIAGYVDLRINQMVWMANKYVEFGAFATALSAEMPDIVATHQAMKVADNDFEQYDSKDFPKKVVHQAWLRVAALRETRGATAQAWKKRKPAAAGQLLTRQDVLDRDKGRIRRGFRR